MVRSSMGRRRVVKGLIVSGVAGLAGCLGGDGNSSEDDDVTEQNIGEGDTELRFAGWGTGAEDEAVTTGLESFAQQSDGVAVNYENIPWENYQDRLQTQFGAGEEPDTFYINYAFHTQFAQEDLLVNLSEEFDDEFVDGFNTSVFDQYRMPDGNAYMAPFAFSPVTLNYNEELLSQAGYDEFPETWSEFEDALVALQEETEVDYPYLEDGSGNLVAYIWRPWMYANGGQIMNEDNTECVVASDEVVEALEFFRDLREQDLIGTHEEIGAEEDEYALVDEQVAMATSGAVIASNIRSEYPDFYEENLSIARPPRPDDGEFGNEISGAGYAVSANSENIDQAVDMASYMLETGIMPYLENGVALSVRESHTEEIDLYNEDERYQTMMEMTEDPHIGSPHWGEHSNEISNVLHPQIEGVMAGQVEPRDALETVEDEVNNEILD